MSFVVIIAFLVVRSLSLVVPAASYFAPPPPKSPATGLPNRVFDWRGQKIRWQVAGDVERATQSVVLVHGLFVNADHWRKTLEGLGNDENGRYAVYALDLLGCGHSSKPDRESAAARKLDGQNGRFDGEQGSVVRNVNLGTADGKRRTADVELRHPLNSCYNFFTWAEQICDFVDQVVLPSAGPDARRTTTLACNSIGTISSLQSVVDRPDLFDGVLVVSPNFRELHVAEVPLAGLTMPAVEFVQRTLRENGKPLFRALAKPDTVKKILEEPYAIRDNLDDELVDVLLSPLLTKGADDVVFDTLSYSAGPLPEQQLDDPKFPVETCPVWICYGSADPWTPAARVEALREREAVKLVKSFDGVGHCPHDEAPELVNPLLVEFLETLAK